MTRILVTGVAGQVGGALVAALRPAGAVMAADRAALDLARPEEIAAALGRLAPELIINPAAYTAVDRAEDERDLAFRVNGEAPGVIARWAAARGAAHPFLHRLRVRRLRRPAVARGRPARPDLGPADCRRALAGIIGKGRANCGAPLAERFAASGGLDNLAASGVTSCHGFAAAIVAGSEAAALPWPSRTLSLSQPRTIRPRRAAPPIPASI
jgi:RmlD substrate binding domain